MILLRHHLCYLDKNSRPALAYRPKEINLFDYWITQQFPLIYTRQPQSILPGQLQLAIPHFDHEYQQKYRCSFVINEEHITDTRELPSLHQVFPHQPIIVEPFEIGVFGSYCWQYLTQKQYIHNTSDADLLIHYKQQSLKNLRALLESLKTTLILNIDAEVRFIHHGDCSLTELLDPQTNDILFKTAHDVLLIDRDKLYEDIPTLTA